jgi:2-succinyl-6-hydroxy-2,4-cyclohexadiene-1-carboxylate synthase
MQKLPPFHLVGYSMGGRIARQYPGPVLSLTLISTHPGLKSEQECADRLKKDESLAQEILSTPIDEFLQRWYDQPLFKTLRSKLDICRLRKEQNREGLAAAIRIYSLGLDTGQKGAKNLIGEKDVAYRMHYKDIPHVLIPDAGHAIHLENPIQLAKEIYDHVLSVETSVEPVR